MWGLRAEALWEPACGAGRALGMRATDARFFTGRRTAGTTSGLGAAFLTFAFVFAFAADFLIADLTVGFFALAAFFLAPLPGFLLLSLAIPSSLRFEGRDSSTKPRRGSRVPVFVRQSVFPIVVRRKRAPPRRR